MRRLLTTAIAAAAVLALGACGSTEPSNQPSRSAAGASTDENAFPVTIHSALGDATIEKAPERVVTIGWGSQDAALALGVVPVGMQDFSGDCGCEDGILPWDEPKLDGAKPALINATSDEVPYEQIAGLAPDVILAVNSGLTKEQYAKLSQIAPTVAYPGKPWLTSSQDQLKLVGQALGRSSEAAQLQKQTDQTVARAAKAHPEFKSKTIAFGSGTEASSFNFYYDDDSRNQLLSQLGFTISPDVSRLGAGGSAFSFAKKVSLELLPQVKTDILVSWYLSPETQRSIETTDVFKRLPYVADGAYVPLTDPPLVYATSAVDVLSLPWMLDKYLPLLSKAAKAADR